MLIAGAVASLGQAPLSLPIFSLLGFAFASAAFIKCKNWWAAGLTGWLFGAGYFVISLSWIVEPFLVHAAEDGWMAPFAITGMAGGMALLWGIAFTMAFVAVGQGERLSRVLALALAIAFIGLFREFAFTGFPWALPAYIWSETPVAQSVAWFGPHVLSLLTMLAASAYLLFARPWIGVLVASAGIALIWFFGELRLAPSEEIPTDRPVVRVVQPNVVQDKKWDPAYFQDHYMRLLVLTGQESERSPDAIVWPETAATFVLQEGDERLATIASAANTKPIAIGIRRWEDGHQFNSLAIIGAEGAIQEIYDKRKLVPFGEYIPLLQLFPAEFQGLAADSLGRFTKGESDRFVELGQVGKLLALICYESIFPRFVRTAERHGGMVQITNDGWFGTISGPQQHFAQARMRSIELGLPLIRAANTGISAVVDSKGRIIQSLPLGVSGVIDAAMPPALPPTLYSRSGDFPLIIMLIMALIFCLARQRLRKPD